MFLQAHISQKNWRSTTHGNPLFFLISKRWVSEDKHDILEQHWGILPFLIICAKRKNNRCNISFCGESSFILPLEQKRVSDIGLLKNVTICPYKIPSAARCLTFLSCNVMLQ